MEAMKIVDISFVEVLREGLKSLTNYVNFYLKKGVIHDNKI